MIFATAQHWAYIWLYQNQGVGNFTDDAFIVLFCGWFVRRAVVAVRARHVAQRAHEAAMEASQQALHDHLGTGHTVGEASLPDDPPDVHRPPGG